MQSTAVSLSGSGLARVVAIVVALLVIFVPIYEVAFCVSGKPYDVSIPFASALSFFTSGLLMESFGVQTSFPFSFFLQDTSSSRDSSGGGAMGDVLFLRALYFLFSSSTSSFSVPW